MLDGLFTETVPQGKILRSRFVCVDGRYKDLADTRYIKIEGKVVNFFCYYKEDFYCAEFENPMEVVAMWMCVKESLNGRSRAEKNSVVFEALDKKE